MRFRILSILLTVLVIHCGLLFGQVNKFDRTFNQVFKGISETYEWYDIPIGIAYFSHRLINENNIGDKISIAPAEFDREFASEIGINGRSTFGSIDKDLIPMTVFFSRLSVNLAMGFFTNEGTDSENFKKTFLFHKSLVYTYTLTEYVKNLVKRERPDGSDNRSFFSGHTSTTFAAATYLFLELNGLYNKWDFTRNDELLRPVMKASTFGLLYGWAGYVGYSRLRDNKHYLSDVLIGAAAGTLISYLVYSSFNENSLLDNIGLEKHNNSLALSFQIKF